MHNLFTRRTSALVAATAVALGTLTMAPAPPAGAVDVSVGVSDVLPVTWVDGAQRQYVLTATAAGTIVISRDTASGKPDASWGAYGYVKGLRQLSLPAPAAGATLHRLLAADDGGTITAVWEASSCASPTSTCDRYFGRFTATGDPVGAVQLRTATDPPVRALTDGSILTGATGGSIGWRSPTGADRGAPAVATADLWGAAVDHAGRLLVSSKGGSVTRWPSGGPADLSFASGCTAGALAVGGSATDDGFATACGAATAAAVVTTRYEPDGTVRWTTTGVPTDKAPLDPQRLAIDSADHVWVAGSGTFSGPNTGGYAIPIAAIADVAETGATARGYQRWEMMPSRYDNGPTGVFDLRPALGDHVAYADLQSCCTTPIGDWPMGKVFGAVLPTPATSPALPTCQARNLSITAATPTSLSISFLGCSGSPSPDPTGYLVEAGGHAVVTGLPATTSTPLTATVGGLSASTGVQVLVRPIDADGEGTGPIGRSTFLPFRSYDDFIVQQYLDLVGRPPTAAERSAQRTAIGGHGPAWLPEQLLDTARATTTVEPVTRLYRAYFLRDPDRSGLGYWVRKHESGTKLATISEQFARSGEFARRYGTLANRAFVLKLYRNVFDRDGDAQGIDFWTKRLDDGRMTRGAVVLRFSESSENHTRTDRYVAPIAVSFLMLHRLPTAAERDQWASFADPHYGVAGVILQLQEYADLVS